MHFYLRKYAGNNGNNGIQDPINQPPTEILHPSDLVAVLLGSSAAEPAVLVLDDVHHQVGVSVAVGPRILATAHQAPALAPPVLGRDQVAEAIGDHPPLLAPDVLHVG